MLRIFAALLLLIQVTDAPKLPEVHQLKVQLIFAKAEALQEREKRIELQYEKDQRDLEAARAKLNQEWTDERKAIYQETEVPEADWDISPAGFVPKTKR